MVGEWTETLYLVIPVGARNIAGQIASKIMPDRDEDKMFDSIRLSASGKEPAQYLMSVCPCTKRQAAIWRDLLMDEEARPGDYPDDVAEQIDNVAVAIAKSDAKFVAVLTNRLNGTRVLSSQSVRVIPQKYKSVKAITGSQQVIQALGLQRIIMDDEG